MPCFGCLPLLEVLPQVAANCASPSSHPHARRVHVPPSPRRLHRSAWAHDRCYAGVAAPLAAAARHPRPHPPTLPGTRQPVSHSCARPACASPRRPVPTTSYIYHCAFPSSNVSYRVSPISPPSIPPSAPSSTLRTMHMIGFRFCAQIRWAGGVVSASTGRRRLACNRWCGRRPRVWAIAGGVGAEAIG